MKNDFYFILKTLFVAWRFGQVGKWLDIRKLSVISNIMTPHTGKQLIIIHILPNISRSKDNQAIKFSHLIAYKVRNIFLEKSCKKCNR